MADKRISPARDAGQEDLELDLQGFFAGRPRERSLYDAAAEIIRKIGPSDIKVHKTQISFGNPLGFAFVSLPIRRVKGRPERYIVLSFGLDREVKDPRIAAAANPYPGRWTHHVIVAGSEDLDDAVASWLADAYRFAIDKRPGRAGRE